MEIQHSSFWSSAWFPCWAWRNRDKLLFRSPHHRVGTRDDQPAQWRHGSEATVHYLWLRDGSKSPFWCRTCIRRWCSRVSDLLPYGNYTDDYGQFCPLPANRQNKKHVFCRTMNLGPIVKREHHLWVECAWNVRRPREWREQKRKNPCQLDYASWVKMKLVTLPTSVAKLPSLVT